MQLRRLILPFALALICAGASAQTRDFKMGKWTEIQNAILKELSRSYVDELPIDRMERAAIDAMLSNLDPYTVYIPAEEGEDLQMLIAKTYGGVGAIIYKPEKDGNVIINEPYEGSPAALAGLRCGDEVLEIDGKSVVGLDTKECSDRMKGQPDTKLTLKVKKVYTGEIKTLTIRRRQIHLPDIAYCGMIGDGVGYICQTGFSEGVADSVRAGVKRLKEEGMKKLVLDLRGNGGGLMSEAVDIVSMFVPKGSLVVSQKGNENTGSEEVFSQKEPVDLKLPIIVLVDGGSASASEIVSGALQDLDRATIMGKRTYGKGLVQNIKPLPYGGKLKVTVAKYYTPSGRCVQAIDYSKRDENGSVSYIPDSLTHEFKTAGGRIVKDGGGITPDVEIPVKKYSDVTYDLVVKGLVEQYTLKYVREHETIPAVEDFHFTDIEDFKAFVKDKVTGEVVPEEIIPFIEEEIVIRYYYQTAGMKIRLRYDTQLETALESPLI